MMDNQSVTIFILSCRDLNRCDCGPFVLAAFSHEQSIITYEKEYRRKYCEKWNLTHDQSLTDLRFDVYKTLLDPTF